MLRIASRTAQNRQQLHLPLFSLINSPIPRENVQNRTYRTIHLSNSTSAFQRTRKVPQTTTLQRFSTAINRAMAAETAVKDFFSSPHFAVVGASSDQKKFGHKIFVWYLEHDLDVIPINPSATSITAFAPSKNSQFSSHETTSFNTLPNLSALPNPTETSVSIITSPKITLKVLEEAKKIGVPAVWLQPGTYDDEILEFAKKEFKAGIGGEGGGGGEGWCVLVDGDYGLQKANKL